MSASIETSIWMALKARIETLPLSPPMPIVYPAQHYEPGAGGFLVLGEVIVAPRRVLIDKPVHDRAGSITIVSVQPFGYDLTVYKQIGGVIAEYFGSDKCARHNGVTVHFMSIDGRTAHVDAGYRDGGWWRVPVIIPWRTWA